MNERVGVLVLTAHLLDRADQLLDLLLAQIVRFRTGGSQQRATLGVADAFR